LPATAPTVDRAHRLRNRHVIWESIDGDRAGKSCERTQLPDWPHSGLLARTGEGRLLLDSLPHARSRSKKGTFRAMGERSAHFSRKLIRRDV